MAKHSKIQITMRVYCTDFWRYIHQSTPSRGSRTFKKRSSSIKAWCHLFKAIWFIFIFGGQWFIKFHPSVYLSSCEIQTLVKNSYLTCIFIKKTSPSINVRVRKIPVKINPVMNGKPKIRIKKLKYGLIFMHRLWRGKLTFQVDVNSNLKYNKDSRK